MDPYDEAQHREDHPSHSIPNAAYPDSAYRPGEGHQTGSSAAASSSSHGLSNSGSFLPASQSHPFYVSPQAPQQQSGPWVDGAAKPSNLSIPNGPPPPYDPSRTPSSYSPLAGAPLSHQEPSHHNDIPLQDFRSQDVTPVSAGSSSSPHLHQQAPHPSFQYPPPPQQLGYQPPPQQHAGPQYYNQQQPQPANQLQVPPSPNPNGSGASTVSSKIGPMTAARLRKKRRMKICIVVAGAVLIFITALMIGIGLGVIKGALHDNDDDNKPDHGPGHDG